MTRGTYNTYSIWNFCVAHEGFFDQGKMVVLYVTAKCSDKKQTRISFLNNIPLHTTLSPSSMFRSLKRLRNSPNLLLPPQIKQNTVYIIVEGRRYSKESERQAPAPPFEVKRHDMRPHAERSGAKSATLRRYCPQDDRSGRRRQRWTTATSRREFHHISRQFRRRPECLRVSVANVGGGSIRGSSRRLHFRASCVVAGAQRERDELVDGASERAVARRSASRRRWSKYGR